MRSLRKLVVVLAVFLLNLILLGGLAAWAGYRYLAQDLPALYGWSDYRPALATVVRTQDGRVLGEFHREHRHVVRLAQVPKPVIETFLDAEDADFYVHQGVDLLGVARATLANLRAGEVVQGGSTITQQVVKSLFLTPERTIERKLKEWILAVRLERRLSKDEILELYLNQIYFGHGAYGLAAAAEVYFAKRVEELGVLEASLLAGLPKAPSRNNPYTDFAAAKLRQRYVLTQMTQRGHLTSEQARELYDADLGLAPPTPPPSPAAEYVEHVRRDLVERYGSDRVLADGLAVEVALDWNAQLAARAAVERGVEALDQRMGWRGPLDRLDWQQAAPILEKLAAQRVELGARVRGLVRDVSDAAKEVTVDLGSAQGTIALARMDWAAPPDPQVHHAARQLRRVSEALEVGDLVWVRVVSEPADGGPLVLALSQEPAPQGALLAIEPGTRAVRAMVGAYDPATSEFNRATQAVRQPGSAFKPVVYLAALEKGVTAGTVVLDTPIVMTDDLASFARGGWKPANFDEKFKGPIIVRDALVESRNIPTIRTLMRIGPKTVIDLAKRVGFTSPLEPYLTLALGASGVTLLEITDFYATLVEGGLRKPPVFVTRVTDRDGQVIEQSAPEGQRVVDADLAFVMTHLLTQVVEEGTGRAARTLDRPAGGKTGTTNDFHDAWFVGFTPQLVAGVWVGTDDHRPLGRGETGSKAALPIWVDFMKAVHAGLPVAPFPEPAEDVSWMCVEHSTGYPCDPGTASSDRVMLPFRPGTEPTRPVADPTGTAVPGEVPPDFSQLP